MRLNTLRPAPGSKRPRLRVGRGASAGQGKTCGRGTKGQRARKGGYHKVGFEGGQMPLQRRMPKVGFRSAMKASRAEVRLSELAKVEGALVDLQALLKAGVVPSGTERAKVVLSGALARAVTLKGVAVTKGARAAIEAARFGEIRSRFFFLIGALVVYRIGTFIPVPGVNPAEVARFFGDRSNTILGIVNLFSGGALSRLSIFAMGVMPYISASIIIQMMSMVVPTLMELRKEGESGRRKITQYTRIGTVGLALVQSFAAAGALTKGGMTLITGWSFLFTATITMTTGTMFLMWLGEQITERGIGNGISMIILSGIVAGLPGAVGNTAEAVSNGEMQGPFALLLIILVLATTAFVVFMERAQRRIRVDYAKRQVGRRMYAGQSSHLPFKMNMSG